MPYIYVYTLCFPKVNMDFATLVDYLLRSFEPEAQPVSGRVQFILSLCVLPLLASLDKTADNGRLDFTCNPEVNSELSQECLSRYSVEMSSFLDLHFFTRTTASILIVFWSARKTYRSQYLKKIRRKTVYQEKEQLCRECWKNFLLHVCCEAVVIAFLLLLLCYTQKMHFTESTYNCTPEKTLVEVVVTCRDVPHRYKANLIIVIIGVMALIFLLCIWTIYYATCRKEEFIKDLLDLTTGNEEGTEKLEINAQPH